MLAQNRRFPRLRGSITTSSKAAGRRAFVLVAGPVLTSLLSFFPPLLCKWMANPRGSQSCNRGMVLDIRKSSGSAQKKQQMVINKESAPFLVNLPS